MPRRAMRTAVLGIVWIALATAFSTVEPKPPLRVLFVGNSLTSTNNLPAFVAAMARASGDRTFSYRMIAPPGVGLEDHWRIPRTRRALAEQRWDAIVMQQGPSAEAASRAHLCVWSKRFADEARARGAQPYVLGVWSAGRFGLPEVIDSYTAAAAAADSLLLPAGSAWAAAWRRKHALALHARDSLHPSRLGTYLAALVVYGGLRNVSPLELPRSLVVAGKRFTVSRPNAAILRVAAAEALATPMRSLSCRL
jgi:hypothetical protein